MPGGGEDDGGKRRDLRGVVAAPAADASAEETRAFLGEVAQEGEVLAGHLEEFFKTVARLQGSSAMAKKAGVMADMVSPPDKRVGDEWPRHSRGAAPSHKPAGRWTAHAGRTPARRLRRAH